MGDLKGTGQSQYTAISNHQDCSKRFTFYSLADLFNRTTFRFLGEASSYTANNSRRLFVHTYTPLSIARYSFIQLSELEQRRLKKIGMV